MKVTNPSQWRTRYEASYREFFRTAYPAAFAHDGYIKTTYPDIRKANGLTQAIIKFLTWQGHRATRINSTGRLIQAPQRMASGVTLTIPKFIPGTTRRGAADVSATILGRSVMLEVKVGNDTPSPEQLREQGIERAAGGIYEFIHNMMEFYEVYDSLCLNNK